MAYVEVRVSREGLGQIMGGKFPLWDFNLPIHYHTNPAITP